METDQLKFWKGAFGSDYIDRNTANETDLSNLTKMWSKILSNIPTNEVQSILEVGSNIGRNLRVLKNITKAELNAVEPIEKAVQRLIADNVLPKDHIHCTSGFEMSMFKDSSIDFVFTNGVLIHVAPKDLPKITDEIFRISKKYIVCSEYFSDKEEEVNYRGNTSVLFKRDFGSYYLDRYPSLQLVNYGFEWKPATGLDNNTWFIFKKTN